MNDADVKKLRGVIKEEVTSVVKAEVTASEQRLKNNLKEELTQVVRTEMSASEQRLERKIKQLSIDIGDFISDRVLPLIADKADKSDIERLERKIDRNVDKDIEQDRRLDRIELIPAIAHDLRKSAKKR